MNIKLREDAEAIIQHIIKAVDPENAIRGLVSRSDSTLTVGPVSYNLDDYDRIEILAGGKAACPMARATLGILDDYAHSGLVCTKYGHASDLGNIEIIEAAHPVPDENSVICANRTLEKARSLRENDLAIVLISGGASAIWCAPVESVSLEDKRAATSALLACGADIHEMNCIRKHLSVIKGGRLAEAAHPARVISLMLSDVTGDDMTSIASGPTVPDPTTFENALDIISKHGIEAKLPHSVIAYLKQGAKNPGMETPKSSDGKFGDDFQLIVGSNSHALNAAQDIGKSLGYDIEVLKEPLTGEAREAAVFLCDKAKKITKSPSDRPRMIVAGGETTVTLRGNGRGGRNQEMALQAALELDGFPNICFVSFGTDGNDGPTDAAGAVAGSSTVRRAEEMGIDPKDHLRNNDSYNFFKPLNDLVMTGPTGTNVMDIQLVLIGPNTD